MVTSGEHGLAGYLAALCGRERRGAWIELRYRHTAGMDQLFTPVERPERAARLIDGLAPHTDVYVGCAPRRARSGGKDAVARAWWLWADCDGRDALERLERFEPQPAIVVRSGSGENRHAYWPLRPAAGRAQLERANRRLALALGADSRSAEAARILRPPETLNHKHSPPTNVWLERLGRRVLRLEEVVAALPDPPGPEPDERGVTRGPALAGDDDLRSIAPTAYVELLTGHAVGRDRKARCPFHEDRIPSLHAYPTPERGWHCFSCGRGGSIFDLAAHLWGVEPRGRGFLELRDELRERLQGAAASAGGRAP